MKTHSARIHVLTGGPYHPVTAQFQQFQSDLGSRAQIHFYEGIEAFDHLKDCDLLVLGGLHWTGSAPDKHWWPEGVKPGGYHPPTEAQKAAYVQYVASGRPLLGWHGGIASYDDWPEFGTLLGFRWDWRVTLHSQYKEWQVKVEPTGHPVVEGVGDYQIQDEIYYNVQITPGLDYAVHAWAQIQELVRFPMILTGQGARIAGAGKTAYLANGHDLKSTSCEAFRKVVVNTLNWLLSK
ncbi:MAG: ThuA domain-containing protein [Methylacidiphilales bacterium]|nr:ThuA domain-containing protein [Candidatus Methylacidiphilales bacterium]